MFFNVPMAPVRVPPWYFHWFLMIFNDFCMFSYVMRICCVRIICIICVYRVYYRCAVWCLYAKHRTCTYVCISLILHRFWHMVNRCIYIYIYSLLLIAFHFKERGVDTHTVRHGHSTLETPASRISPLQGRPRCTHIYDR